MTAIEKAHGSDPDEKKFRQINVRTSKRANVETFKRGNSLT